MLFTINHLTCYQTIYLFFMWAYSNFVLKETNAKISKMKLQAKAKVAKEAKAAGKKTEEAPKVGYVCYNWQVN